MRKRIVLINPPFLYFPDNRKSGYNYSRPPLGLCYLASYLESVAPGRYDVEVIDAMVDVSGERNLVESVAARKPDIVGVSVVTPTAGPACDLASSLRALFPNLTLVAGGPHATIMPQDLFPSFDVVVRGEGEETFTEICARAASGESFEGVKGCAFRSGDDIIQNDPRSLINPLDEIPPPARNLLDASAYYHSFPYRRRKGNFTTLFSSRGCPNDCYFCGNNALWRRKIRFHSIDYVSRELETLKRDGYSLLFFDDDDFLSSGARATELCEEMIRRDFGFKWICHGCAKGVSRDVLSVMKRAGCVEMQVGVESGSDAVLGGIDKCASASEMMDKLALVKKSGINLWTTFIVGHEKDTKETVEETIRFAVWLDPTYASFIPLLPFPGSRAFDEFKRLGWLKTENWDDYNWYKGTVYEKPDMSGEEIVALRKEAHRRFYLRPRKILSMALHTIKAGHIKEMTRNFISWISIMK